MMWHLGNADRMDQMRREVEHMYHRLEQAEEMARHCAPVEAKDEKKEDDHVER
jgi:hypothetical protein